MITFIFYSDMITFIFYSDMIIFIFSPSLLSLDDDVDHSDDDRGVDSGTVDR